MKLVYAKLTLIAAAIAGVSQIASASGLPVSMQAAAENPVPDEDVTATARQDFKIMQSNLVPTSAFIKIVNQADSLLRHGELEEIKLVGTASPDGSVALNDRLARERAASARQYFMQHGNFPPSVFKISSIGEDWTGFQKLIETLPGLSYREKVLDVLKKYPNRDEAEYVLRTLDGGTVWEDLAANVFPRLRSVKTTVKGKYITLTNDLAEQDMEVVSEEAPQPETEVVEVEEVEVIEPVVEEADDEWHRRLTLKTNAPAWLMLWINGGVEIDIVPHLSAELPIYYSGFNYFTRYVKFRTLTFQPEVRFWPNRDNNGFFVGAHFGLGWYNCSFNGDIRYQDHNRSTPAIGGGLSVGYRFNFCRNHNWKMEVTLGYGAYKLDYDLFNNVTNGLIVGRRQRTFYGIDRAAVSFCYQFDLNKKKGGNK